MESHNIEYEVFLTEGIGDARTAARRLTDSHDEPRYIIAVGGDGTMNEVLDGVDVYKRQELYSGVGSKQGDSKILHKIII